MKKAAISIIVLHLMLILFSTSALAYTNTAHGLSLVLPSEYTELTAENAEEHADLLDSLGYDEKSFLKYLDQNGIMLFALADNNKKQIIVKSWSTDFSKGFLKDIGDLALLNEDQIRKDIAPKLITDKKLSYKIVTANTMKMIEIRTSSKDSGGDFSSIQYLTIRDGRFYSLIFTFSESTLSNQSAASAWSILAGFKITAKSSGVSYWDVSSILIMIIICLLVLAAIVVVGIILYSFIKDLQNRQKQVDDGSDISIKRRKF